MLKSILEATAAHAQSHTHSGDQHQDAAEILTQASRVTVPRPGAKAKAHIHNYDTSFLDAVNAKVKVNHHHDIHEIFTFSVSLSLIMII